MASRDYSEATKKALFALSLGQCYAPECSERVVQMAGETPIVKVEIAHIRAAKKGGPRYDENMGDDERKAFPNLLLLCVFHHKLVDRKPTGDNYSIELLQEWKTRREGVLTDDLTGLTEEGLTEILTDTLREIIGETKDELLSAISKVEATSRESAELLRTLVDETFSGPHLDADTVATLAESARAFGNLPDYAPMLLKSSRSLDHLPDYAPMLSESSRGLVHLPDYASMLRDSTQGLLNLPDYAPMIRDASSALVNLPDYASMLQERTHDLESAIDEMEKVVQAARRLGQSDYYSAVNNASKSIASASSEITKSVRNLQETAQLPLSVRPPDRWTYIRNSLIAGVVIGTLLTAIIWYLVAHSPQ